jgi:undecaprenyl-diphosphatase
MKRPAVLPLLIAFALVSAAALGFLALGSEMLEGDTGAFDRALLMALRTPGNLADPIGPPWLEHAMFDITALGGVTVLSLITAATAGFLLLTRKRLEAAIVAAAVGLGLALSTLLKQVYGRARPDFIPQDFLPVTLSFPSGHAMLSAIVYLTLGALVARAQPDRRVRIYIVALAVLMTVVVGVSRIYLAVHWPTDVIAGWTVGAAWALLSWMALSWFQGRK